MNRKILQAGIKLKKLKKLHSVFSRRGEVFVRVSADSEPVAVPSSTDLFNIISYNTLNNV